MVGVTSMVSRPLDLSDKAEVTASLEHNLEDMIIDPYFVSAIADIYFTPDSGVGAVERLRSFIHLFLEDVFVVEGVE